MAMQSVQPTQKGGSVGRLQLLSVALTNWPMFSPVQTRQ